LSGAGGEAFAHYLNLSMGRGVPKPAGTVTAESHSDTGSFACVDTSWLAANGMDLALGTSRVFHASTPCIIFCGLYWPQCGWDPAAL